jgi:hypoxanthine-guanine phosphoribosyltransferase
VEQLRAINGGREAVLLPVTALELTGLNAIPDAMAQTLAEMLNWPVSLGDIIQTNRVGHTRARAFNRFVTPAAFGGRVLRGAQYVLVDDHVGMGGTLANLKGFLETNGGQVVGMTTLSESRDARQIALRPDVRDMLREKHGEEFENLWQWQFGHGVDALTNVEAGILCREQSIETIRNRLAQAVLEARERGLAPRV